jgi:hypothetical protein
LSFSSDHPAIRLIGTETGLAGATGKTSGFEKTEPFCFDLNCRSNFMQQSHYFRPIFAMQRRRLDFNAENNDMLGDLQQFPETGRAGDLGRTTHGLAPIWTFGISAEISQSVLDTDTFRGQTFGFGRTSMFGELQQGIDLFSVLAGAHSMRHYTANSYLMAG